jgi:hypothetical protein
MGLWPNRPPQQPFHHEMSQFVCPMKYLRLRARLLTHVNAGRRRAPNLRLADWEETKPMTTEVAVVSAAIIFVFIVFAAVLAWGDYYSRSDKRAKKRG